MTRCYWKPVFKRGVRRLPVTDVVEVRNHRRVVERYEILAAVAFPREQLLGFFVDEPAQQESRDRVVVSADLHSFAPQVRL